MENETNERTIEEEIITSRKPTLSEIVELREQKLKIKADMLSDCDFIPESFLTSALIDLLGMKGKRREIAIKILASDFLNNTKLTQFTRSTLQNYILINTTDRTKRRIIEGIINCLKAEGRIKEEIIKEHYYGYDVRSLISADYGSYEVLKNKNSKLPLEKKGCYSMGSKSFVRRTFTYTKKVYVVNRTD